MNMFRPRSLRLLLPALLLVLAATAVPAQSPVPLRLRTADGHPAATVDASGNLALRGGLTAGDSAIAPNPALAEWFVKRGDVVLALIPLEGPDAGNLRLRGQWRQGQPPQATHPWCLRAGGTVLASLDSGGNLYLAGQLEAGALAPLEAPELLAVDAASGSTLELAWSDVADESGYRVEMSLSGAGGWTALATTPSPLAAGTTAWTAEGLSPGARYYFRVVAENAGGRSAPSNVLDGRTLGGAPGCVDYAYDGWQVLEQYADGAAGPARQWVYGVYIDEPLVMDVNGDGDASCTGSGDSRYFYHQNLNYSVVGLTDTDGTLVEAYAYTPYGGHVVLSDGDGDGKVEFDGTDVALAEGPSVRGNSCLYTGQRFDGETGLHYYKHRYYDGQAGRFASRDFIMHEDSVNLYVYVANGPLISLDPSGLVKLKFSASCKCKCDENQYDEWKKKIQKSADDDCEAVDNALDTVSRQIGYANRVVYDDSSDGEKKKRYKDLVWFLEQIKLALQDMQKNCRSTINIKCKKYNADADWEAATYRWTNSSIWLNGGCTEGELGPCVFFHELSHLNANLRDLKTEGDYGSPWVAQTLEAWCFRTSQTIIAYYLGELLKDDLGNPVK